MTDRGWSYWGMLTSCVILLTSGCMSAYKSSVGAELDEVYERIYLTDMNTAWNSVVSALKSYEIDVSDRDIGHIKTHWMDNENYREFYESFATGKFYQEAMFRLRVWLSSGFYNGVPSVKVRVSKDQVVQKDILDGWEKSQTDGVEENTLLYRIGHLIRIHQKLEEIEQYERDKELEELEFGQGA